MTPIQWEFLDSAPVRPDHFNQAMLLSAREDIKADLLQRAFQARACVVGGDRWGVSVSATGGFLRHCLGQTKVEDFDRSILSNHHIGGFKIAMDDALLMSGFECFRDLLGDIERIFNSNRALLQVTPERYTLDILHHKKPSTV